MGTIQQTGEPAHFFHPTGNLNAIEESLLKLSVLKANERPRRILML